MSHRALSSSHQPYQAQKQKAETNRLNYRAEGRKIAQENRPLHIAGTMLYWGEGAKDQNSIRFINSDANMLLLFIRFLRDELAVQNHEIAIRIHCHNQHSDEIHKIEQYWLDLLQLPETSLRKTLTKHGNSLRVHNKFPNGFCTILVHQTRLIQHIYGAIQEYSGYDEPDWMI